MAHVPQSGSCSSMLDGVPRTHDNEDPLTPADVYEYDCAVVIPKWQGRARGAGKKLKDAGYEPTDELAAA